MGKDGGFFGGQNPFNESQNHQNNEKTISIKDKPEEKPSKSDGIGDYIEYEEVKD